MGRDLPVVVIVSEKEDPEKFTIGLFLGIENIGGRKQRMFKFQGDSQHTLSEESLRLSGPKHNVTFLTEQDLWNALALLNK